MKDLAAMFTAAGCQDVKTYIQSGNVLFRAKPELARKLGDRIAEAIAERFGFRVPVLTRTAAELAAVARANPFLRAGADQATLHVAFLADRAGAVRVSGLDAKRSPPDQFTVLGREIYLHCPNGLARTKLTNDYFDTRLATTSTVRNWRTVLKLLELAAG